MSTDTTTQWSALLTSADQALANRGRTIVHMVWEQRFARFLATDTEVNDNSPAKVEALQEAVAQHLTERAKPTEPTEIIRAIVALAALEHPALGLSFGYIGNLERWGDDRSWRVFTRVDRWRNGGTSVTLNLGSTDNLPNAAETIAARLSAFIARWEV